MKFRALYDLTKASKLILETDYPQAEDFAGNNVIQPPSEESTLEIFNHAEIK